MWVDLCFSAFFFFFFVWFFMLLPYKNKQKQKLALSLPKKNLTCSISKFFFWGGILGQTHSNIYFLSLIFWLTFNNLSSQRWDGKRLKTSQGEPLIYSVVFFFLPTSPPFFALTRLHFGGKFFGITYRIVGLGGRKCKWCWNKIFLSLFDWIVLIRVWFERFLSPAQVKF